VESIGRNAMAREESKMILGLPELIVGGGVGLGSAAQDIAQGQPEDIVGSLATGALAGGLLKGARKYGPGLMVSGASGMGKVLQADPTGRLAGKGAGLLNKVSPEAVGSAAPRILGPKNKKKKNERGLVSPGLLGGVE